MNIGEQGMNKKQKKVDCPYTPQCRQFPEKRCSGIEGMTETNTNPNRFEKPLSEPWKSWEQFGRFWAVPEEYSVLCPFIVSK